MKRSILSVARAAVAAATLAIPAAKAGAVSYSAGDLFLGVRASSGTGATQDYLVNIGQASVYRDATTPFTVGGLGDLGADLSAIFEANWNTRADVSWSISGTPGPSAVAGDPSRTLYATTPESAPYLPASPLLRANAAAQAAPTNKLTSLAVAYLQTAGVPNTSTANSSVAIVQTTTDANSYASFQTGASSYSYFSPTIEGNFANGAATSVLDLYRLAPATDAAIGTAGDFLGTFTLGANGALTFVPKSFAVLRLESAVFSVGEAGGQLVLKVFRGGNSAAAVSATFTATEGSAHLGIDYSAPATVVSFAAGETQTTVTIPIADRSGYQGDRSFTVALSNPSTGATLVAQSAASVTIVEAAPPPPGEIAFGAASFQLSSLNGSGNPNSFTVTLNRSNGSAGAVSAEVSVTGGTLTNGSDFNAFANPTVVIFAAGETSKTVSIQLKSLTAAQLPGTILLGLANATGGASIGVPASTTINVISAGGVSFSAVTYQGVESASGDSTVTVTVSRSGGQTGAASVDVAVTGGSASAGVDFALPSTPVTLSWADGESGARSFDVTIKSDAVAEGDESVLFALQNAVVGIAIVSPSAATLTILDVDSIAPVLTLSGPKVNAKLTAGSVDFSGTATDNQGVARVEISLNGGAAQSVVSATATTNFNWSLTLTPEQGINTAQVTAFDLQGNASASITRSFKFTNLRPQLAGSYNGLVVADPVFGTAIDHHGLVAVSVTPTGKFTGKVTLGGATFPISGVFLTGGDARFGRTLSPTLELKSGLAVVGALSLKLDTGAGEKVTGALVAGGQTRASIPHADRAPFTAQEKTPYTAVFQAGANVGMATSSFPQGDGYGSLTVDRKGVAKIVGKLADGSVVSYSNAVSKGHEWPVFMQLYGKRGFIAGAVTFDTTQPHTDAAGADLKWFKPAGLAGQKLYPDGWPAGITTDFLASKYLAPVSPVTALGAGLPSGSGANVVITAADGGFTIPTSNDAILDSTNKLNVTGPTSGATGASGLKGAFSKRKGALSGSFTHPVSGKVVKFGGVAFQKTNTASGYFIYAPVVTSSPAASGAVGIAPK